MSVTIYGASDDLIEIEGDIREEFPALEPALIACSDGTLLRVEYTRDGIWRITTLEVGGPMEIVPAPPDDEDNYTDRAILEGPIRWIALASEEG